MPWLAGVHPLEKLFDFDSKKNGTKKVKQRKVYISKGKAKERMILLIFHLRQQLGTIVGTQNKHTIVDQGCSWTTPCFLIGF